MNDKEIYVVMEKTPEYFYAVKGFRSWDSAFNFIKEHHMNRNLSVQRVTVED